MDLQEKHKPKKPILFYYLIAAVILLLLNALVFPSIDRKSVV